jgi:hypothetical protein
MNTPTSLEKFIGGVIVYFILSAVANDVWVKVSKIAQAYNRR